MENKEKSLYRKRIPAFVIIYWENFNSEFSKNGLPKLENGHFAGERIIDLIVEPPTMSNYSRDDKSPAGFFFFSETRQIYTSVQTDLLYKAGCKFELIPVFVYSMKTNMLGRRKEWAEQELKRILLNLKKDIPMELK